MNTSAERRAGAGWLPNRSVQRIHFEDLSGFEFERLLLAFALRSGWRDAEWIGQAGGDGGRDIWCPNADGTCTVLLCANYKRLTFAKAKSDLVKVSRLRRRPEEVVVIAGGLVSARLREKIKEYARVLGFEKCSVWPGPEVEERIRITGEHILERFCAGETFPESRAAICAIASGDRPSGPVPSPIRQLIFRQLRRGDVPAFSTSVTARKRAASTHKSIFSDLRMRLTADFAAHTPLVGYFGALGGGAESTAFREPGTVAIGVKVPYYLTYWGWHAALLLRSSVATAWRPITIAAIQKHFGGRDWLTTEFVKEDGSPMALSATGETVRHSIRAAEILLLIGDRGHRVVHTLECLLQRRGEFQCADGGWIANIRDTRSSLWSSIYAFHFFRGLSKSVPPSFPYTTRELRCRVLRPAAQLERFLWRSWRRSRWGTKGMPWQYQAPSVFAEVAPHATNRRMVSRCFRTLASTLTSAGRLSRETLLALRKKHPPLAPGMYAKFEYLVAVRIAFALAQAPAKLHQAEPRFRRLAAWLVEAYEPNALNTCDIAFLAAVLMQVERSQR